MPNIHRRRIERIRTVLGQQPQRAAMLLSSAPAAPRTRDISHAYRPDSDLFYLTGAREKNLALLISARERRPLLFVSSIDPAKIVWEGRPADARQAAARIGAELIESANVRKELYLRLKGVEKLYYQNIPGALAWSCTQELMARPSWERGGMPASFQHADAILEPMRLIKEAEEVGAIRRAIDITQVKPSWRRRLSITSRFRAPRTPFR
jgi:Xaa-Pro aminopeptidase